jgi:uncharacterized protein YqjF (DUF2071 family)
MHWPVPIEKLRPLVPDSLEIDRYQGMAYVGVVPFLMQGVRPKWWPKGLGFQFPETNVRTYVYYGDQPGVYFLSLEASSRPAVWAARKFWGLPYYLADMSLTLQGDVFHYQSRRCGSGARHTVRYRLGPLLGTTQPDTLEHFFLERYLLFVERRSQLFVGQVHHVPYPAQQVEVLEVQDELAAAAGLMPVTGPPAFAHFASGVDVEVFGLQPIRLTRSRRF